MIWWKAAISVCPKGRTSVPPPPPLPKRRKEVRTSVVAGGRAARRHNGERSAAATQCTTLGYWELCRRDAMHRTRLLRALPPRRHTAYRERERERGAFPRQEERVLFVQRRKGKWEDWVKGSDLKLAEEEEHLENHYYNRKQQQQQQQQQQQW